MPLVEEPKTPLEAARKSILGEVDKAASALKDLTLKLEQSQGEVNKLSQRNSVVTAQLQQIQTQSGVTVDELRSAYDTALDAQQRLFVMRGQVEKLKGEQLHQQQYRILLENLIVLIDKPAEITSDPSKNAAASIESIIQAQEAERQRLSRQMHDGPAQALSNFILQTEIAMRLMDVDNVQAREELKNLKASALSTFQKVRNFIFELRPMMLDDLGLFPTIKRYADTFKEQTGLDVNIQITGQERRLESYIEVMIFRALQELMGNAARHSQVTNVNVTIDMNASSLRVAVFDNGKGFNVNSLDKSNSLGLNLIKDRVQILGGSFDIDSAIGKGSRITLSIPVKTL